MQRKKTGEQTENAEFAKVLPEVQTELLAQSQEKAPEVQLPEVSQKVEAEPSLNILCLWRSILKPPRRTSIQQTLIGNNQGKLCNHLCKRITELTGRRRKT